MPVSYGYWLDSWVGSLDDMGVWNRELTPCEVSYLYYGGNHSLAFAGGHVQSLTICENSPVPVNYLLAVNDSDIGITDTWTTYLYFTRDKLVDCFYQRIGTSS